MKKSLLVIFALAACVSPAPAQLGFSAGDPLAGSGPFSDPSFQDMIETSEGGYLNPANTLRVRSDFGERPAPPDLRDAPASPPPYGLRAARPPRALPEDRAGLPQLPAGHYKVTFAGEPGPVGSYVRPPAGGARSFAREYVMIGVAAGSGPYDALLPRLEAAGLRFAGEKTSGPSGRGGTVILGWAAYADVPAISRVRGVAGVTVEKKSLGIPMRAKIRFTLKVPFQNRPNAFVPDFIRRLEKNDGFAAESWFRLPQAEPDSKFSVFDVAGVIPVDKIGELSRSPFVASVEFNDSSL